jgi:hypothetical protein
MKEKKNFMMKSLFFSIIILILVPIAKSQTVVRKKIFKLINKIFLSKIYFKKLE